MFLSAIFNHDTYTEKRRTEFTRSLEYMHIGSQLRWQLWKASSRQFWKILLSFLKEDDVKSPYDIPSMSRSTAI